MIKGYDLSAGPAQGKVATSSGLPITPDASVYSVCTFTMLQRLYRRLSHPNIVVCFSSQLLTWRCFHDFARNTRYNRCPEIGSCQTAHRSRNKANAVCSRISRLKMTGYKLSRHENIFSWVPSLSSTGFFNEIQLENCAHETSC